MISADCFFKIGSSHEICQDYAVSSLEPARVILSDGCSTAPDSDIGSRLIVLSKTATKYYQTERSIVQRAKLAAETIGLPEECLSATLLSVEYDLDTLYAEVWGDGVVVARKRNGNLEVFTIRYKSGAPYYLRYSLDPITEEKYVEKFGTEVEQEFVEIINGEVVQPSKITQKLDWNEETQFWFPKEQYDVVAIFSDGVQSFQQRNARETSLSFTPVSHYQIIKELFSFKGFQGHFVNRRCNKALKEFEALGLTHTDDFSMAAIYVESSQ